MASEEQHLSWYVSDRRVPFDEGVFCCVGWRNSPLSLINVTIHSFHEIGVITAIVIDLLRAWLLVGTNRGVLTLWDLRFMIAIKFWVHPSKSRISRLIVHPEPHHPSHGGKVTIASSKNEVCVWDLEMKNAARSFVFGKPFDTFKVTEPLSGSDLLRNSFTSNDSNISADQSVRAVIFPADCEYMIMGGMDRKI